MSIDLKDYSCMLIVMILLCILFFNIGYKVSRSHYEPIIEDQEEIIKGYEFLKVEKVELQDGIVEVRISFQKIKEEISHFQYWAEMFKQIMREDKKTGSMKIDKVSEDD